MRNVMAVLVLVAPSTIARGAFTDFSDYSQTQSFAAGEIFHSNGLGFKAVDFSPAITNRVEVTVSGSFAALYAGPGVEFQIPVGIEEISFFYSAGAGSRISVNGVEPALYPGQGGTPFQAGFEFLNGSTLGGVPLRRTSP